MYLCCSWWIIFLGIYLTVNGQKLHIEVHSIPPNPNISIKEISDSSDIQKVIKKLTIQAAQRGQIAFSVDSVVFSPDICKIYVYEGDIFRWDTLDINLLEPVSEILKLRDNAAKHLLFKPPELYQAIQKQVTYWKSIGYLQAKISFQSLVYRKREDTQWVSASLLGELGAKTKIDSIILPASLRERPNFIYSLLRMRPGEVFNPLLLPKIPNILNNSLYYQQADTPRYRLTNRGAVIHLNMQPRKNSRFDFLAGLLPPVNNTAKFQFTITADLMLISAFRTGEAMTLQYNKLPDASQKLYIRYKQPFIFKTLFSPAVLFELQKQDTTFLRRKFEPSIAYDLAPGLQLQLFYRNITSNLLQVGQYKTVKWPPPPFLDTKTNGFGIGINYEKVDYKPSPSHGKIISGDICYGQKKVFKTTGLDSLDYSKIPLQQPRIDVSADIQLYFKLAQKRHILKTQLRGSWIYMKSYFLNELPQYGGAKSLRGFNENLFTASAAAISTVEYRYLLEKNSFFAAFVDYGMLLLPSYTETARVSPLGIGVGLQLETGAGLLNISYAAGKWGEFPLNPLRGKIHLGFVSLF